MTHCLVILSEEHDLNIHFFQMFVPRINAEHIQSWVHEFTEMGVYFALVDMGIYVGPSEDVAHILACLTCGANNSRLNRYFSADEIWRRRKDIDFRIESVLPTERDMG